MDHQFQIRIVNIMPLSITWLGHSTFLIKLPSGQSVVTDPWLSNDNCPPKYSRVESLLPVDLILVSHGHDDHSADVAALSRATGAAVVCSLELSRHLTDKGLTNVRPMGLGGTQVVDGIRVTMTPAMHSSSMVDGGRLVYLGVAAGFVIRADDTPTMYFAGDTALFGDMAIIRDRYAPQIAFLPIGDHFTMGPADAAIAARWLGVRQVVPMHWGTWPVLTGTPDMLRTELANTGIEVLVLEPGQTAE
jgi:L-ascorbate metabolism protein UlaG (beta-lactamase superfamily)